MVADEMRRGPSRGITQVRLEGGGHDLVARSGQDVVS